LNFPQFEERVRRAPMAVGIGDVRRGVNEFLQVVYTLQSP